MVKDKTRCFIQTSPFSWIQRHVHIMSSGWLLWLACLSEQCWISFKEHANLQQLGLMNYCYSIHNSTSPQKVNDLWHYLDVRVFHVTHVDENKLIWTWLLTSPSFIPLIHLLRLSLLHPTVRNPNFKMPGVAVRFLPSPRHPSASRENKGSSSVTLDGIPNLGIMSPYDSFLLWNQVKIYSTYFIKSKSFGKYWK